MSLLRELVSYGAKTQGPSAVHSGNMGDVVYSLPACKALGVTRLLLNLVADKPLSGRVLSHKSAEFLAPLLVMQPWLQEVAIVDAPVRLGKGTGQKTQEPQIQGLPLDYMEPQELGVTWILDRFRQQPILVKHLIDCHADAVDAAIDPEAPFLELEDRPEPDPNAPIVLSLTPRYRYLDRHYYRELLQDMGPVLKIGIPSEAHVYDGIPGELVTCTDALDLAQRIASARCFVGSPSLPYAIAEGLKTPRLVDVPVSPLNAYPRGADGWLLPADVQQGRKLLRMLLEQQDISSGTLWQAPSLQEHGWSIGLVLGSDAGYLEAADSFQPVRSDNGLVLAELPLPVLRDVRRLRLDIRLPWRALLLCAATLMDETGEALWQLTPDTDETLVFFSKHCLPFGLKHPPLPGEHGALCILEQPHASFDLPLDVASLQTGASELVLQVELRPVQEVESVAQLSRDYHLARQSEAQSREAMKELQFQVEHERGSREYFETLLKHERDNSANLQEQIIQLQASSSWRLTRPLRWASSSMKQLLGKKDD